MVDKIIVHNNRCGMEETKKETKKSVFSNTAQAISKRILVADDNKVIRNAVAWFLIKERSPSTPVILLTGCDRETVWKKVESAPVASVIFKPFRLKDLQRTVQGALASREREHGSVGVG